MLYTNSDQCPFLRYHVSQTTESISRCEILQGSAQSNDHNLKAD